MTRPLTRDTLSPLASLLREARVPWKYAALALGVSGGILRGWREEGVPESYQEPLARLEATLRALHQAKKLPSKRLTWDLFISLIQPPE